MPDARGQPPHEARRRWMAVLAKAPLDELEAAWASLPARPAYRFLRRPESGLVIVRGRIGGNGAPFNLGEVTATRCTVELEPSGPTGVAYVTGRDGRKAELAAALDALLQRMPASAAAGAVAALAEKQRERARTAAGKVAASKVEFFTMVRE